MWGVFYGCEECGYEVEALDTDLSMNYPRPLREAVLISSYELDHSRYPEERGKCQVSDEAPGSPWAS